MREDKKMRKRILLRVFAAAMAAVFVAWLPVTAEAVDATPYASNVSVSGDAIAGQPITGVYTYNSNVGDPESGTTFRWLKSGDPVELYTNYVYTADGSSGPTEDTVFTLSEDTYISGVKTYHSGDYNEPGTLALRDGDGFVYGPWEAVRAESYTTFYWLVSPNTVLPAGTYTVVDSNPDTWSYNALSSGQGQAWVYGNGFAAIDGETGISYTPTLSELPGLYML
jgi:hypothetical protein